MGNKGYIRNNSYRTVHFKIICGAYYRSKVDENLKTKTKLNM